MRTKLLVIVAAVLFGTQCLCFGESWKLLGQKVVRDEKPTATVEIYVTDWCPYCAQAVKFLQANQIPYVAYDVEKDREAAERMRALSGRNGVPFAMINGRKVHGFSEETYAKVLGLKGRAGRP